MQRSDNTIHNICLAAIRRATIKPYDFRWTRFYETGDDHLAAYPWLEIAMAGPEQLICSVIIGADQYSLLTTRRLITMAQGNLTSGSLMHALDKGYGDFKGYQQSPWTMGSILSADGTALPYFIETGRASMVMIYGVRTCIGMRRTG
ncbi:hypothetical protein [Taibaiella koreensis]|uniref:hypothetical protein n=1 Tax=Taibaiella koreensis TaxID=1268548 RepID=UPI000E59F819|nr:hypothetical protein [Taibaiella koreensis]